jgi:hypothetical protein
MRGLRVAFTVLGFLLSATLVGCGGELMPGAAVPTSDGPEPQMTLVSTEETDGSPEGISRWNVYEDAEGQFFHVRGVNESGEEVTDLSIPQELAYAGDELDAAELARLLQDGSMQESSDSPVASEEDVHAASIGYCERQLEQCESRCRRMRSPRGRALCWAACMAQYAACIATR